MTHFFVTNQQLGIRKAQTKGLKLGRSQNQWFKHHPIEIHLQVINQN